MKILLTGATGFLGKHLLELLLSDSRVEKLWVTTRSKRSHPHSKVEVIQLDLSDPGQVLNLAVLPDAVIHLAGLYDFEQSYASCYTQNVLPAVNLAKKLKDWNQDRHVPLYLASTYAVTFGQDASAAEEPLKTFPPTSIPYAYTKAIAERAITDAHIPCAVFRLGMLIGTSNDGSTDKLDGPYAFLRLIESTSAMARWVRRIPIPAKPDGILPLVPVDSAAKVFHDALFRPEIAQAPAQIFGVYDSKSIPIRDFSKSVFDRYAPDAHAVFFSKAPASALRLQSRFTPISADAFKFAIHPVEIENRRFQKVFSNTLIPHFQSYENAFYAGYRLFTRGTL